MTRNDVIVVGMILFAIVFTICFGMWVFGT